MGELLTDSDLKTSHLQWNRDKIRECEAQLGRIDEQLEMLREEKLARQAQKRSIFR